MSPPSYLALEPNMQLQRKRRTSRLQAFRQYVPIFIAQYHAEIRHGDIVDVDGIGVGRVLEGGFRMFGDDQWVAEETLTVAGALAPSKNNPAGQPDVLPRGHPTESL